MFNCLHMLKPKRSYSSSSSSSSSAPTSSGSTLTSSVSSSSSSASGGKTVAIDSSSSCKIVYVLDLAKSATVKESPISNADTSIVISSGISLGTARTSSSNNGCCKIPPSFAPAASPSILSGTETSISSDISIL